jgi:hypothetical protein
LIAWRSASHWRGHRVGLRAQVGQLLPQRLQPLAARRSSPSRAPPPRSRAHHAAGDRVELLRHRVDLGADRRARLVDEVDRLVGQEAVGDVAVRERRGGDQRGVLDAYAVVDLEALAQPAQDRDRVLDRGSSTMHGWKRRSSAASFSMCFGTRRASSRRCSAARRARASA